VSSRGPADIPRPMTKAKKERKEPLPQFRFGIGEWYGKSFVHLSPAERKFYASLQFERPNEAQPCPFLSRPGASVKCWKTGGICSLRSYERSRTTGLVRINPAGSTFRATCPSRFEQGETIYRWIGETILQSPNAVSIGEVPFLRRVPKIDSDALLSQREVGRIDKVLVVENTKPLQWCPVEKQAVYFSGKKMALDFGNIAKFEGDGLPFPLVNRRPDYRSSAPKRLMPQLQVKVPTLRTWGKKMAVVVDQSFFDELGNLNSVNDLSNAEVVWFVVKYVEQPDGVVELQSSRTLMTTLEESVRGLVAAVPVSQPHFEETILTKLQRLNRR
jgi:Restriction endonuclease NotI